MKRIFVISLVLVSAFVWAQSTPFTSLPFTVENNHIYFYCKVNETDSIKFLFDTGANGSVINKQSLKKLNLNINGKSLNQGSNGVNEVESSSGNKIKIGNILKKDISFTIISFETDKFDGVFGTDLMKGHIIEIDYHNLKLNFFIKNDNSINYTEFTKLKLYSSDIYPSYIKSTIIIKGKKYKGLFGLDTGADDVLTIASPFAKKNDFINKATKIGSSRFLGSNGVEYEMPIVLFPEVEFAKKHIYRIPAALSNVTEGIDATDKLAGFFGNAFLNKFNIILDYDNGNIYFRLNNNLYKEYYE